MAGRGSLRVVCDRRGRRARSGRVLCRLSRRRAWPGGARSGDDGGVDRVRVRDRRALVAADRAALSRGRRVPGDHGQPGARSRHDRALPGPPRARAERAVRAGAGAVRGCGAGARRRGRGRWHEGACQRVRARDARLRADRARDPRTGRRDRRARGRAVRRAPRRRAAAARSRRARGASGGCATPSGGWISGAPRRPGRSRARAPSGSSRRAVGWRRNSMSSGARTPNTRPTGRAG